MRHRWGAEERFVATTRQLASPDSDDAGTGARESDRLELLEGVRLWVESFDCLQVVRAVESTDGDNGVA
jgi:hypothetical protein